MSNLPDSNTPSDYGFPAAAAAHAEAHDGQPHRKKKQKVSIRVAALNITSFMDLTFNLLLFFVLTASFSIGEGVVPADLPLGGSGGTASTVTAPPKTPLVISLRTFGANDQVTIQFESISTDPPKDFEDLHAMLKRMQFDPAKNPGGSYPPDNPVIIKPDTGVQWQHVVDAFNSIVRARFTNVSFAALPQGN